MSASKPTQGAVRRLSGASTGLLSDNEDSDFEHDTEESEETVAGRKSNKVVGGATGAANTQRRSAVATQNGRRRSSFGGARFQSAEEQEKVVAMYTNVIKLSSENKINEKNSWGFDLIDQMGKLIKEDSKQQRGVNFQKASCTLDASVKIYSHRVDDTYTLSHRVLESFSRNELSKDDDGDGDDGNDSDDENREITKSKKAAKVGSKKRSNNTGSGSTIEKNIENINTKEIENEVQIDPMFQTMSKLFDKGGIDGLLLSNLKCIESNAALALNTDGLPDSFTGSVSSAIDDEHSTSLSELKFQLLYPEQYNASKAEKENALREEQAAAAKLEAEEAEKEDEKMRVRKEKLAKLNALKAATGRGSATSNGGEGMSVVIDENDGKAVIRSIVDNIVLQAIGMDSTTSTTASTTDGAASPESLLEEEEVEEEGVVDAPLSSPYRQIERDTLGHMIDITDYVQEIDLQTSDLLEMPIIPQLDEWRHTIGTPILTQGSMDLLAFQGLANSSMQPHPFRETYNYNSRVLPFIAHTDPGADGPGSVSEELIAKRKAFFMPPVVPESTGAVCSEGGAIDSGEMEVVEAEGAAEGRNRGVTFSEQVEEQQSADPAADMDTYDYSDDNYDNNYDHGDGNAVPFEYADEGDCDEDGNYIASERRMSMAAGTEVSRTSLDGTCGRQSMARGSSGTRMSMVNGELVDMNKNRPSLLDSKIQWDAVNGPTALSTQELTAINASDLIRAEATLEATDNALLEAATTAQTGDQGQSVNEYSFLNIDALATSNNWAGAQHWKWGATRIRTRNKPTTTTTTTSTDTCESGHDDDSSNSHMVTIDEDGEEVVTLQPTKKTKAKKSRAAPGFALDFRACLDRAQWPEEGLFGAPKKAASALMTTNALEKLQVSADNKELFLPKDEKVQVKDLCRLCCNEDVIVPPLSLESVMRQAKEDAVSKGDVTVMKDILWNRSVQVQSIPGADGGGGDLGPASSARDMNYNNDNDDGGNYDDDGYDYTNYEDDDLFRSAGNNDLGADPAEGTDESNNENISSSNKTSSDLVAEVEATEGATVQPFVKKSAFDIDESKLIQLDRKVEKINIGYAKVPKKVNVKQLKVDIWTKLSALASVDTDVANKAQKITSGSSDGSNNSGSSDENMENEAPDQDFHSTDVNSNLEKSSESTMSFTSLVKDINNQQKQKDVTCSFYFICLLHLANEKCLKIEDGRDGDTLGDISDLQISGDMNNPPTQGKKRGGSRV